MHHGLADWFATGRIPDRAVSPEAVIHETVTTRWPSGLNCAELTRSLCHVESVSKTCQLSCVSIAVVKPTASRFSGSSRNAWASWAKARAFSPRPFEYPSKSETFPRLAASAVFFVCSFALDSCFTASCFWRFASLAFFTASVRCLQATAASTTATTSAKVTAPSVIRWRRAAALRLAMMYSVCRDVG